MIRESDRHTQKSLTHRQTLTLTHIRTQTQAHTQSQSQTAGSGLPGLKKCESESSPNAGLRPSPHLKPKNMREIGGRE